MQVTVIIPTYNYAHFIQEAINSVFNSNFPRSEIEIIVIDDGSTDNTKDVVAKYGDRLRYIYQENQGKAIATQVGINEAQGKYIFNLDADDYFLPNKIQEVVKIFESDSEIVHVAHPAIYWTVDQNTQKPENIPDCILNNVMDGKELLTYFYEHNMLFGGGSTFAGRANALKSFTIPQAVDMYIDEYLVLFTVNQGKSFFISEPLNIWRIHGKNFSGVKDESSLERVKIERNLSSMRAILRSMVERNFDSNLQKIYYLKLKVITLSFKENLEEKKLTDVLSLWIFFLQSFNVLNSAFLRLIKSYTLLNRSLPTPMIRFMKNIKRKFF
jgi:glycosyltransferase involved in cell wall biosynthesis